MTRYTLTLPTHTNDGETLIGTHDALGHTLRGLFGGYTVLSGEGSWSGQDTDYRSEDVNVYVVDTNRSDALDRFRRIARWLKCSASQEAIYLTAQPIFTELIC